MNIEIKSLRRAALWALALAALSAFSDRSAVSATATLAPQSTVGGSTDPLPPEQAFPLKVEALDATTLLVQFTPAPDHYLYKSKISFALNDAAGARLHVPSGRRRRIRFPCRCCRRSARPAAPIAIDTAAPYPSAAHSATTQTRAPADGSARSERTEFRVIP